MRLTKIENIGKIPNLKLVQISFAENSKVSERKNLLDQLQEILLNTKSIEYTNIFHWTDENMTKKLNERGIKNWNWDMVI